MEFNKAVRLLGPVRKPLRDFLLNKRLEFPKLISLELTNACNAKCIMCPREQLTRKIGNISMDVVEKLCKDSAGKPLKKINVFGFGESLLHPKFPEIIRYIKHSLPDVELNLSTNAQLLNAGMSDVLISSGIDNVNIDIDGVTKETYEKVRRQLNFETVTNNTENFIEMRNKNHAKIKVSVTMIDMDITGPEIEAFTKKWSKSADTVFINHYNTWTGVFPDRNKNKKENERFLFPCKNPWREMIVNYDGSVSFCCMDFNSTVVIGNIMQHTIQQIWTDEKMQALRTLHLEGRQSEIPICRKCNEFIFQSDTFWANLFYPVRTTRL